MKDTAPDLFLWKVEETTLLRKHILLVEDQIVLAKMEKRQLEHHGYSVRCVTTGEEAVQDSLEDVDLILMDIDLGEGMNGVEAAKIILRKKDIPLVFLSAHDEAEIVATTEKVSSYGYILKNSGMTVLLASLRMAIKLFETKKKLQENEFAYRQMFYCNPHPMWIFDVETLEILKVNDAAVKIYGYSRKEFESLKITDIRPQEDVDRLKDHIDQQSLGLDYAGKWRHVLKNGRIIHTSIISHAISWLGHKAELVLSLIEEKDLLHMEPQAGASLSHQEISPPHFRATSTKVSASGGGGANP